MANASNTTAPTQFIQTKVEKYAYRRFGKGPGLPLLCLQHFTGTLDNWDPAVTDPLALGREVILFESAGLGRSTGQVPENMAGMAAHALAFVDALGLKRLDILGYASVEWWHSRWRWNVPRSFTKCCLSPPLRREARTLCTWINRSSGRLRKIRICLGWRN